ncbi:exosome non-catalytic core subunit RRP46 KNAG_0B01100 [Huiozyma naganishii CBS 8797]|uniref:Uncharacterized protein n=1 Tax=Huiozyma naganishii (strain ATCC MYA-139 / BCRC 22969 / CBS 8797 / KCTC 17520 / NBRC 10181 / NCYC 3082 / Yp74L-3) TaxID=1071383 RepID=J7RUP0_HUIN7|nr:hypothetical protein KNAG_0B01100 [Kazachstania naganishii CBS 8797]CCK68557.1 hypothetical protein KNAG_0B01100 [Kazachstania naganishii CBS 8797]
MGIQTGYLDQVDGSAHYKTDTTALLCSVTGPIEPKPRQELPTRMALEVIVRPALGVPLTREVEIQDKLNSILGSIIVVHRYPRQLCQITFQILESGEDPHLFDSKELVACVNAATLALIDAGIAMNSLAIGCVIAVLPESDGKHIIDPTDEQLRNAISVHSLVLQLVDGSKVVNNVLLLDSYGDFTEKILFEVLELGEKYILNKAQDFRKLIQERIEASILK